MPLAPRLQRLAAQRRRYTEERIAARVAQLGFADVGRYLVDRVAEQGWLLAEVAAYLRARHVAQGWSVKRMRAELRVGRRWLVGELARLGCDPDHRIQQRRCWASVGPQACSGKVSRSPFSPWSGDAILGRASNRWDGVRPATFPASWPPTARIEICRSQVRIKFLTTRRMLDRLVNEA